jgi:hypothetical protein
MSTDATVTTHWRDRNIDVRVTPLNLALARNAILLALSNPDDVRSAQGGMPRLADDLIHGAVETGHITNDAAVGGTYLLLGLRRSYKRALSCAMAGRAQAA